MTRPRIRRAVVLLVVAVLAVAGIVAFRGSGPESRHLTATFPSTVNLYEGAQVKVLGVQVGEVTSVEVEGTAVTVEITYDGVELPADVSAMIVPPSIVGDRFVQLAPAYTGGAVLADGATLGLDRTGVPVELDDTYRQLDALSEALGPQGANQDGALSRLVRATAAGLDGNGRRFNRSIRQLAGALDTLASSDAAYQDTVDQTGSLTRTLMANDKTVRRLVLALARVSGQLNAQRDDIARASTDLSGALDDVARFVRTNRSRIKGSVAGLRDVTRVLTRHTQDLQDLLALAPVGFVDAMNINLPTNYDADDPRASTPLGRTTSFLQRGIYTSNLGVTLSSTLLQVCQTVSGPQAAQLAPLCEALAAAGNDLGVLLSELSMMSASGDSVSQAELYRRLRSAAGGRP
ncbi:MAG: MCE family protein [Nocardioides sp.]